MSDLKTIGDFLFEPADVVELRAIRGKAPNATIKKFWSLAKDLPRMEDELHILNGQGFNIYYGANPRKDFGLSGDKNVLLARCLFIDIDNREPGDGCGIWDSVYMDIFLYGLPEPTLGVFSGNGVHVYWRLNEPVTDLQLFTRKQKALIRRFDADKSVHNAERVMRLPGFKNTKDENNKKDCFIVWEGAGCTR